MQQATKVRCRVLLAGGGPLTALDYAVPDGMAVEPGQLVQVPLGPRTLTGAVWEADALFAPPAPEAKLRPIAAVLEAPPLASPLRRLIDWTARYYVANPSAVLRMAISVSDALAGERQRDVYRLSTDRSAELTPRQRAAVQAMAGQQGGQSELAALAGTSTGIIRALIEKGVLTALTVPADAPYPLPDPGFAPPTLSPAQSAAAAAIAPAVSDKRYEAFLLDGITGSGKTEVYFDAIRACLEAGRQALVLLPEIALTAQWHRRFAARFGCAPVGWHSGLSPPERRRAWRAIATGQAQVVVGARSALFLPFPALGLIIIDEEHEASFKQEDGVCYQARDVAVMRASLEPVPIVLASATPSLETIVNAAGGRYRHLVLDRRHGGAQLPEIRAIDLRKDPAPAGRWLSPPLLRALQDTLERKEQSLLFLNRRGYAPLTLCRSCGERISCPHCSAWLVEHRLSGRLQCHHCGFASPLPTTCPACGATESLVACGPGVERVAEEVTALLPDARVLVVTSDTMATPARVQAMVDTVTTGAVDIIVGTQLVAKGHHFPGLTLVGVVDADIGLGGGDLRAAERTFQQITQVAGRAGRAERPGRVLLQSWQPEQAVLRALLAQDRAAFEAAELAARERHRMPPYGRLAAIIVSGDRQAMVEDTARMLAQIAPHRDGLIVLGPAPAPLAMLRGRHRQRLLVKADKTVRLSAAIETWLAQARWPAQVRVSVDIDPYSFL